MRPSRRWAFALMVACGGWLAAPARAYELTGSAWRMSAYPDGVPYCPVINSLDANTTTKRGAFAAAVDGGLAAWTATGLASSNIPGAPCSAFRLRKTTCTGTPNEGDSQPWVWWEANWSSIAGVGPSTIGVTPWWSAGSEITRAKVIFNDQNFTWSTDGSATDVGSIAVHEFGHFVGLDHYDEYSATKEQQCAAATPPSVMCSYYSDGVMRVPTGDDTLGICYLYPQAGALGSACQNGSSCTSGLCHAGGYCTQACPPSCPLGYSCAGSRCERDQPPPTCPACATMPCGAGSVCIGASGGTICTGYCSLHTDCPSGFYCVDLQGGGGVCWPAGDLCDGNGPTAGQACSASQACAFGNICLELSTGGTRCFATCRQTTDCTGVNARCYQLEPGLGYCDAGSSTCSCDTDAACQTSCSCDPDCDACPCDLTPDVCNPGCACDGACPRCTCDLTFECEADCACDPECGCTCDQTTACDADCGCDPECDGCFGAALLPDARRSGLGALVVLGLLLGVRRRRTSPIRP